MKKRPNIIIFNPDEMRYDAMSHMGNPAAETPFLDEFAGKDAEQCMRSKQMQLFYRTVSTCAWSSYNEQSSSSG